MLSARLEFALLQKLNKTLTWLFASDRVKQMSSIYMYLQLSELKI